MMYINIEKDLIPYKFDILLGEQVYEIEVHYNGVADFFTMNLTKNDEVLVVGEKLVYGSKLFETSEYKDIPDMKIVPYDISGESDRITYENFNEKVFLYVEGD